MVRLQSVHDRRPGESYGPTAPLRSHTFPEGRASDHWKLTSRPSFDLLAWSSTLMIEATSPTTEWLLSVDPAQRG
jgi:hypothetical protein